MTQEPELVCVRSCQGFDQAQIYKSKLEAMGIPHLLQYESVGPVYGITIDGLGRVRILVPKPFAGEASMLLADLPETAMPERDPDEITAEEPDLDTQDSLLL